MAGLGHGQAGRRTGLGAALSSFSSLLKGPLFQMMRVRILSPKLNLRHLTPTASTPVPYYPVPRRPTIDQQHVVQSPQLPIGRSSPSFSAIGQSPAAAPPSAALRWYSPSRLRRGGKVHCAAAWGVGKSRRGGGIPLECFRRVHPTQQDEARIGRELWEAVPHWSGAGTGPAPWPRLRERPGPEFAEGQVGRAQGGGGAGEFPPRARLCWRSRLGEGMPEAPFQPGASLPAGGRGQRLRHPGRVSSRTPASCTPLDSPGLDGHRHGVGISEPCPGTSPELAASQSSRAWEREAWEGPRSR